MLSLTELHELQAACTHLNGVEADLLTMGTRQATTKARYLLRTAANTLGRLRRAAEEEVAEGLVGAKGGVQ